MSEVRVKRMVIPIITLAFNLELLEVFRQVYELLLLSSYPGSQMHRYPPR